MSKSSSLLVLIAANFIPLFGVALFDWDVLEILLLYWTESVIIGALNVLRMFFCHDHWVMERMIEVTNRLLFKAGSPFVHADPAAYGWLPGPRAQRANPDADGKNPHAIPACLVALLVLVPLAHRNGEPELIRAVKLLKRYEVLLRDPPEE